MIRYENPTSYSNFVDYSKIIDLAPRKEKSRGRFNIQIDNKLPESHRLVTQLIGNKEMTGVVLPLTDILQNNRTIKVYRDWAAAHFGPAGEWYGLESREITNADATNRDEILLYRLLGDRLNSGIALDVSCGVGRHSLVLGKKNPRLTMIGMEMVEEPRLIAQKKVKEQGLKNVSIIDETEWAYKHYQGQANAVMWMFNSSGYEFNAEKDQERLNKNVQLLNENGLLVIDTRSPEYQINEYSNKPVRFPPEEIPHPDFGETQPQIHTLKYVENNVLAAIEMITVGNGKDLKILQRMSYGWNLYPRTELFSMAEKACAKVVDIKESYYSDPTQMGERVFIVMKKVA